MAKKANPFAKMIAEKKLAKGQKPEAKKVGAKKPNPFKKGKAKGKY